MHEVDLAGSGPLQTRKGDSIVILDGTVCSAILRNHQGGHYISDVTGPVGAKFDLQNHQ